MISRDTIERATFSVLREILKKRRYNKTLLRTRLKESRVARRFLLKSHHYFPPSFKRGKRLGGKSKGDYLEEIIRMDIAREVDTAMVK